MRPHALAVALLVLDVLPSHGQAVSGSQTQDSLKSEFGIARLHPLELDSSTVRILAPYDDDRPPGLKEDHSGTHISLPRSLAIGPLKFDAGSVDRGFNGKQSRFARVYLSNVHIFGGGVSGTFDGRAATIRLSWPTGN